MTGPISSNQGMRLAADQQNLAQLMAQAAAAIDNLNKVAATASSAINNSAVDRAAIHTALDALTAKVAALPTTSATPASVQAVADTVTALAARVAALEARKVTVHSGSAAIPLLAGTSTTVTITWPTPFPDNTYVCNDPVISSALLGKVTGTVTTQTVAGCTVRLTGTAVSLGSSVTVDATRYA